MHAEEAFPSQHLTDSWNESTLNKKNWGKNEVLFQNKEMHTLSNQ